MVNLARSSAIINILAFVERSPPRPILAGDARVVRTIIMLEGVRDVEIHARGARRRSGRVRGRRGGHVRGFGLSRNVLETMKPYAKDRELAAARGRVRRARVSKDARQANDRHHRRKAERVLRFLSIETRRGQGAVRPDKKTYAHPGEGASTPHLDTPHLEVAQRRRLTSTPH